MLLCPNIIKTFRQPKLMTKILRVTISYFLFRLFILTSTFEMWSWCSYRSDHRRFKLVFNVPLSHLEHYKTAVLAVGAGRYPGPSSYTECWWTIECKGPRKKAARVEVLCFSKGVV